MELKKTSRGFEYLDKESYTAPEKRVCVAQQSSAWAWGDGARRPGTSYLWIGEGQDRGHLDWEEVKELRDALSSWLESGSFRS